MTDESERDQRIEWPPPRDDPDEEPSHPGARLDELKDELEEEDNGADT